MQIYSGGRIARAVLLTVVLSFIFVSAAVAQETSLKGRWGVGLRAGAAMLTQNLVRDVDGDLGPIVSGNIMFALEEMLLLGINVEWETHNTQYKNVDFGNSTTISIIPFVELRKTDIKPISPYLSFGMGINLNSFDLSDFGAGIYNKFDPPTTVALKAGIGTDYFISKHTALNTELGWKYNSGNVDGCVGVSCGRGNWDSSVVSLLLGVRYFF